jgi:multisubunit Na+/H+ antiporter MnhE subunit
MLLRAAGFTAVYLLVLTSVELGDIVVGAALGLALAVLLRPRGGRRVAAPWPERLLAAAVIGAETAKEIVIGSWRVVRFCLGAPASPGFVEIPRAGRSRASVALWGVLTGEAPDELPVDVDDERDVLIVHLVKAEDPDSVRARHRRAYQRWQRKVVP